MITREEVDRLRALKGKYSDVDRCFIVATGPSLVKEDLELIKDEYIFTVNSGYKALMKSGISPDFYVVMDNCEEAWKSLEGVLKEDNEIMGIFVGPDWDVVDPRVYKIPVDARPIFRMNSYLRLLGGHHFLCGQFSNDIVKVVYTGKTVLVATLQVAAYMGFKEIYILGADFDYTGENNHTMLVGNQHITRDLKEMSDSMLLQMRDVAYDANRKGVKIFNATRGGKLDCFERVKLEDIICGERIKKP